MSKVIAFGWLVTMGGVSGCRHLVVSEHHTREAAEARASSEYTRVLANGHYGIRVLVVLASDYVKVDGVL